MLIVTLPPVHQEDLLKYMIEHPAVAAVRLNTGVESADGPYETLQIIKKIADPLKKPIYVDLKGKQLRVVEWAVVPDNPVILNQTISVDLPADIYLRGGEKAIVRRIVGGNMLYIDCKKRGLVGKGQSVNVFGTNLKIEGGLLDLDHLYIRAALDLGIKNFMLSFVENKKDVQELQDAIERHSRGEVSIDECEIVFKIESQLGMDFVRKELTKTHFSKGSAYRLMAARDDLQIHIGESAMSEAAKDIAEKDPRAICASRLLTGLEEGSVSDADKADIELMRSFGYKFFMLSDGISRDFCNEALEYWQDYAAKVPFEK